MNAVQTRVETADSVSIRSTHTTACAVADLPGKTAYRVSD